MSPYSKSGISFFTRFSVSLLLNSQAVITVFIVLAILSPWFHLIPVKRHCSFSFSRSNSSHSHFCWSIRNCFSRTKIFMNSLLFFSQPKFSSKFLLLRFSHSCFKASLIRFSSSILAMAWFLALNFMASFFLVLLARFLSNSFFHFKTSCSCWRCRNFFSCRSYWIFLLLSFDFFSWFWIDSQNLLYTSSYFCSCLSFIFLTVMSVVNEKVLAFILTSCKWVKYSAWAFTILSSIKASS